LDVAVIRKPRAVGIVPRPAAAAPGTYASPARRGLHRISYEVFEEAALCVQAALAALDLRIPYCCFNGGADVFVDVGSKALGIRALQALVGATPAQTVHAGDRLTATGNDTKAREVANTLWVVGPEETAYLLTLLVADVRAGRRAAGVPAIAPGPLPPLPVLAAVAADRRPSAAPHEPRHGTAAAAGGPAGARGALRLDVAPPPSHAGVPLPHAGPTAHTPTTPSTLSPVGVGPVFPGGALGAARGSAGSLVGTTVSTPLLAPGGAPAGDELAGMPQLELAGLGVSGAGAHEWAAAGAAGGAAASFAAGAVPTAGISASPKASPGVYGVTSAHAQRDGEARARETLASRWQSAGGSVVGEVRPPEEADEGGGQGDGGGGA
jgi:hypothetical protein